MTPGERLPAFANSAECFADTTIPKLRLPEDEDWLSLIVPTDREITPAYIDTLNEAAAIAQGGTAAREALSTMRQRDLSYAGRPRWCYERFESQVQHKAQNHFYRILDAYREGSPLFPVHDCIRGVNPTKLVASLRLLYRYGGEQLPIIVEGSSNLLRYPSEVLQRRFEVVEADGLSVPFILLHNPKVFSGKDESDNLRLLERARSVGGRRSTARRSVQRRLQKAQPLVYTERRPVGEAEELSPEAIARYMALTALTGIETELLRAALPHLADLDEQYEAFKHAIAEQAATRDELRLRDVIRVLGEVTAG